MNRLPEKLWDLAPGEVFELVLGIANITGSQLEAIASAMSVLMDWPNSIIAALDADAANGESGMSLSSRLRRFAQLPNTLSAVRSLLIHDLAKDRGRQLGTRAELASEVRKERGMTVRKAASQIGIAPVDVTTLRRAGVIETKSVTHGRAYRTLLTYKSVEAARADLADRMPVHEFTQMTGLSQHAVDQLVDGGHLQFRRTAAIEALYDRPMLMKSSAEAFIKRVREWTLPLGHNDDDWIPLTKAFMAVGGRPKPYSAFFSWIFKNQCGIRAPIGQGNVDISRLYVDPMILHCLTRFESRFDADQITDGKDVITPAVAAELLNCPIQALASLENAGLLAVSKDEKGFDPSSVRRASKSLISLQEINARLGFQERSASVWLRDNKIEQKIAGFALRRIVSPTLGARIPVGVWRRRARELTIEQVERGKADLSNREWDLVRCWIPRRRRSSHGVCDRSVANAAIWITATGKNWHELPKRYGCAEACYARYHYLKRRGAIERMGDILGRNDQRVRTGKVEPFFVHK